MSETNQQRHDADDDQESRRAEAEKVFRTAKLAGLVVAFLMALAGFVAGLLAFAPDHPILQWLRRTAGM